MSLKNINDEEDILEEDASDETDTANIEEEENFLAGFGSLDMDEEDALDVKPSTSQKEKWENKLKKKEKKKGISKKEAEPRENKGSLRSRCAT